MRFPMIVALGLVCGFLPERLSAVTPTNLLIVTADDLNHDSWFGSKVGATPNLDAFAATCVRFEHCHLAAPICQPSREALMTGRVPHRSGGTGFTPIHLEVPTLTEVTGSNGYLTAVINKSAHMAPKEKFNWDLRFEGSGKNPAELRRQFEQCLQAAAEKKKPFFINVNITDPHRPFPGSGSREEGAAPARKKKGANQLDSAVQMFSPAEIVVPPFLEDLPEVRKEMAQYFSGVRRMDQSLAGVLQALTGSGKESNTLIVFMSDNGMSVPFAKASVYRNGTSSPLLVRWPGMSKPSVNREAMISSIDVMPTVLDLLGLAQPTGMDGLSFASLLRGEKSQGREHVFTYVNTVSSGKAFPQRCIRTKTRAYMFHGWSDGTTQFKVEAMSGLTFKAMSEAAQRDPRIKARVNQYLTRTREEFFNTERDPEERENLINDPQFKEEIQSMKQLLLAEMKRSNDPLLSAFQSGSVSARRGIESLEPSTVTGTANAVVVGEVPLVHTAQMLPLDDRGELIAEAALEAHVERVLLKLDRALRSAKSELGQTAKLNVCLSRAEDLPAVQKVFSRRFTSSSKPAVSFVVGNLAVPGAKVAMDAIAPVTSPVASGSEKSSPSENGCAATAVLSAGPKVYVSGMADTNTLLVATRKTLEKLIGTISHLGLNKSDIVQLKSFMQPMSEVAAVRREIVSFFDGQAPPLVFVEWISKAPNPPIEIELIANASGNLGQEADSVSFITPPGTTGSKVYSRVARVNHGKLIYFSGLYGMKTESGAAQVREIFEQIKGILQKSGSDLEHLAKATYYVSDDEASNQLNQIRPEFFNPQRPPAASKAKVTSVGVPGKTVTLDMIAVTRD